MGDMADHLIEQGMDDWLSHKTGDCDTDGPCQYCYEREQRNEKRSKQRRKQKRESRLRARGEKP